MEELQLPVELVGLITSLLAGGVTWLVVAGFKGLGEAFGKDFSNAAKVVAGILVAGVTTSVFGLIDFGLTFIPADYLPVVNQVLSLIVAWLTAAGIQRQSKK